MDVVTLGAALKGAKAYTDATIAPLLGGVHYRGSVNYSNNLPSNPAEGDAYTVKYKGSSGTTPDGTEYVWALDTDDNTYKWIGFSPDTYTKAEIDNLLNNKQNVLTVGTNLDDEPTEDSTNPITSGGVYNTVGNLDAALDSLIMSLEPKTITANGTYNPEDDGVDGYSEVTVNVGGSVSKSDVNFYDYDGTVVASYSAADFANLSAMPANPTHTGLTAQGWNWSLSDAKTYVASYGKLNIGQMYITSDGATRLFISLGDVRLKPYLGLTGNSSGTAVSIDWGDNSTAESVTLNDTTVYTPHEYASAGDYVVAITVTNGSISFNSTSSSSNILRKSATANTNNDKVYQNALTKLQIGENVTSIDISAFYSCYSLTSVTIPTGVTSIGNGAFGYCYSLTSVTIPTGITSISNNAFSNCSSLTSVTIPTGVTDIAANAFGSCYGLGFIKFNASTPATVGSGAFNNIPTDCIIYVPTGSLSAYTSANNYPSSSTYTYVEY